jgi:hypothetical protein
MTDLILAGLVILLILNAALLVVAALRARR